MNSDRAYWIDRALQVVQPVFWNLANGRLRKTMPIECLPGREKDRALYSHLEALGRCLAGIGPWIGQAFDRAPAQVELRSWVMDGIAQAIDPEGPDRMNFEQGAQPLVDAAFLAQGLLRCFDEVWLKLDRKVQSRVLQALIQTRGMQPGINNWILFSAMIEAFLFKAGEQWDPVRILYALRQHEQWYKGDGAYGDGPDFHWDYYNGYVIQPMSFDILNVVKDEVHEGERLHALCLSHMRRYAEVQERMIASDGSFPPIGRSITYRCGAFQPLAQLALANQLPDSLPPGQVRAALTAVISRTLEAPGTFNEEGWLQLGLAGHQPSLAEQYISTGSLYLASVVFLPLGLDGDHAFWTEPRQPWTSRRIWNGEDMAPDKALQR
ncbi:MAG: DUF2264 domain-containing protein [Opitutales bacterium]|nr:DUF2264 domain-containing protein [Opitutales bacterium]